MSTTVRKLEKHPFNVFPAMTAEERKQVRLDIEQYEYDKSYPITLYQDKVLDGWNRQQICEEIGVEPLYVEFKGNDLEAMDFIWRSNRRRNLNSSQWAVIAMEAQPIMEAITAAVKKEKSEKLEGNQNACAEKQLVESVPPTEKPKRDDSKRSATKLAKQFNTNPKYLAKAKLIKATHPEALEQVKRGERSINDVMREEKTEELELQKKLVLATQLNEHESQISPEPITVNESMPAKPMHSQTKITLEISEDILIKLKAYANAQKIIMNDLDWDMDFIKAAVDLLNKGTEHPPFEHDISAMKVFTEEIQRLRRE
jgi:hypothetical protein